MNASFSSPSAAESRLLLQGFVPFASAATIIASISLTVSLFTVVVILRCKQLRRSIHHLAVVHLTAANVLNCIIQLVLHLRRFIILAGGGVDFAEPRACSIFMGGSVFAIFAGHLLHISLAVNRIAAILCPMAYYKVNVNKMHWFSCGCWALAGILASAMALGVVEVPLISVCMSAKVYESWTGPIIARISDTLRYSVAASLALFVLVLIWKRKTHTFNCEGDAKQFRAATRNSVCILGTYVACIVIPAIAIKIIQPVDPTLGNLASQYSGLVLYFEPLVNVVMFISFDSLFRKALRESTCARSSRVASIAEANLDISRRPDQ